MSALLFDRQDGIAILTLNRPEARNAISPEMACRLADAFQLIEGDASIRCAILTGAGDRAFCSGGDLALMLPLLTGARAPQDDWDRRVLQDPGVMDRSALRRFQLTTPLIAAVNGHCLAGGMETMLATDIRISADHATFGLPEARRGLIPFAGALVRLPRQMSHCRAMEMLLTGEPISAAEAQAAGLLNHVLPGAQVMDRALEIAHRIAANGPVATAQIKRTVLEASGRTLAEGYGLEDQARDIVMASEDAREGPRAFMEKRPARFRGV